jgi:hypothetical protein
MWIRGFLPTETFLLQMRTQAVQVIRTCESIHVTVCLQWRPQNWWNNIQGYTANQADWWIKEGAGLTNLLTIHCAHWIHISTGWIARVLDYQRSDRMSRLCHDILCITFPWHHYVCTYIPILVTRLYVVCRVMLAFDWLLSHETVLLDTLWVYKCWIFK